MSRYEPVANVRVSQLAICLDCGALVPIKWRTHHDLFHLHLNDDLSRCLETDA